MPRVMAGPARPAHPRPGQRLSPEPTGGPLAGRVTRLLALQLESGQGRHLRRLVDLAGRLAVAAGMPAPGVRAICWGAALHDLGKLRVPAGILDKTGPLEAWEQAVMLRHPEWGAELLAGLPRLPRATLDAVRHHHERWDGTGYPAGLRGPQIPLSARIVSLADVFDALTSVRAYKPVWTEQEAALYLLREAGRHFDPALTRIFVCDVLGLGHLVGLFGDPC